MNDTKTAMAQAAERYEIPEFHEHNHVTTTHTAIAACAIYGRREAYADCLEKRALPAERRVAELEAENARLRDAAQVAADALGATAPRIAAYWTGSTLNKCNAALAKLEVLGITPSKL